MTNALPAGSDSPRSESAPYDKLRAINWSSLKHLAVSPLLYKWRIDHPEPTKPAYVIGNAIHTALFEPGKFDSRYAVFDGTRRGKVWDEWQVEHPGMQSIKPDEMAQVEQAVAAIRRHRVASRLIDACRFEEVTKWTDPETGLACKGRLDGIAPTFVVDLKSARDVSPKWFSRAVADYLYHGQVAFYHDGATLAHKIPGETMPYLVAAQTDEPYDVAVYQLEPETLAAGRALYRQLLRRLVLCTESDFWPGVAPDLEPLTLPPWAIEQETVLTEENF